MSIYLTMIRSVDFIVYGEMLEIFTSLLYGIKLMIISMSRYRNFDRLEWVRLNRTDYKNVHRSNHYERIELAVPKGMKQIIRDLAADKEMSINAYIQDLVRKDQEGLFDSMQIAEKNREMLSGIRGNMHDGYDVIFKDGYTVHCITKKDARSEIIKYCKGKDV